MMGGAFIFISILLFNEASKKEAFQLGRLSYLLQPSYASCLVQLPHRSAPFKGYRSFYLREDCQCHSKRRSSLRKSFVDASSQALYFFPTTDVLHNVDAAGMAAHEHQPIDQTFHASEPDDKAELLPEHDADRELSRPETRSEFAKCKMGKQFFKGGMRKEAEANTEQEGQIAEQSNPIAHASSDQVVDRAPCINLPMSHQLLTSKQISHAISASENIRLLCAVSIALLVVMSTRGYSWGGKILGSMLNFRPLCLVLLTDITVIIGQLFVSQKGPSRDGEEVRRTRQVEFGFANNIGNMLEVGLLLQKALNATFMDCCICAVFMISGLLV